MAIKYHQAPDIQEIAEEVVTKLNWNHVTLKHRDGIEIMTS